MRTHIPKLMLLGVGGGIAAYMFGRKKRQAERLDQLLMRPDPADPVQSFDALDQVDLDDLDVDALSMADGTGSFGRATFESAMDESGMELDTPEDVGLYGAPMGVPTPRAVDTLYPDDDAAMADGQNWIEALETSAAEDGPLPEQSLDAIVDDQDLFVPPSSTDNDDTPVADRGSGGPGGI